MPLLNGLLALILGGVLVWLVNNYIPTDKKNKNIATIVLIIILVACQLKAFGLLDAF
jgi:hypothetical protein